MEIIQSKTYLACPNWWNPLDTATVVVFDELFAEMLPAFRCYLNAKYPKILVRANCEIKSCMDEKIVSEYLCIGRDNSVINSNPRVSHEYVFVKLALQCFRVPTLAQFARSQCRLYKYNLHPRVLNNLGL